MGYAPIIGIYKITSPSGKVYVGQSIDIKYRWMRYCKLYCENQTKLWHSLKKHGATNHKFEVLQECEPKDLNALERHYIDLYKTLSPECGLNLRDGGGQGYAMSEATKEKLRNLAIVRGAKPPSRLGAKHTEDSKELNSQKNKGRVAWNKGIPRTESQKIAHSERMKGRTAWNKGLKLKQH